MRAAYSALLMLPLAGCSLWMPSPDPGKAWIDLAPRTGGALRAVAVDERPLDDPRYFQVSPGSRRLDMRYRFTVSAHNVGGDRPVARDCRLMLEYAAFAPDTRYRLEAGGRGFRPWAKLYDRDGRLLARAREQGCGGELAASTH